ncbi:uncharacterized protein LOC127793102 [Diospyros lotus]|uniref:uncharacterized protein LOC127793102 n=1 Tax=Diospyros lotus TaxID=55363 RepID=UPI002259CB64|nr:uncharacterized protein LOC127793102 [Diospyros lotus]
MVQGSTRILPGFCISRMAVRVRVRVRAQPAEQYKQSYNSIYRDESSSNSIEANFDCNMLTSPESEGRNRVMVVADSSHKAKGALQWALSHAVQSQDTIVLLHVTTKPSKQCLPSRRNLNRKKAYQLLYSMREHCQRTVPGVHVEIAVVEGKEKGPTIVEEAKQQRLSLLVLGQRKRSMVWRLRTVWMRKRKRIRDVEYCIQNSNCMTIAVRRKSRKCGGYLITTKSHKNFWLLA